jgi:hypothetical protein
VPPSVVNRIATCLIASSIGGPNAFVVCIDELHEPRQQVHADRADQRRDLIALPELQEVDRDVVQQPAELEDRGRAWRKYPAIAFWPRAASVHLRKLSAARTIDTRMSSPSGLPALAMLKNAVATSAPIRTTRDISTCV